MRPKHVGLAVCVVCLLAVAWVIVELVGWMGAVAAVAAFLLGAFLVTWFIMASICDDWWPFSKF